MKTNKQQTTNTTPEPAPQQQPAPEPYGVSGLIRVRRLLSSASEESRDFFEDLMSEWDKGAENLAQTAFMLSSRSLGHRYLSFEADSDRENMQDINTLARILFEGEWVAGFLKRIFRIYRGGNFDKKTPEGTLYILEQEMEDFDNAREDAQEVLRNNPEVLAADLQKLARERPELFKPAA